MKRSAKYCEWKKSNCTVDRNRAPCAGCMYMTGNTDFLLMHTMGGLVGALRLLGIKCPPNRGDCDDGVKLDCVTCWNRWLYQPNSGTEIKEYARNMCKGKRKVKVYLREDKKRNVRR